MKKGIFILFIVLQLITNPLTVYSIDVIDFNDIFYNHQMVKLIIHPSSGEILFANATAADFYGYPIEQLIGMNINEINTLSPNEVEVERQRALEEKRNFFIFQHRLANGDIRTVHVYSYPIAINGDTFLYSIIIDQSDFVLVQNRNRNLIIVTIALLIISVVLVSYSALKIMSKKKQIESYNLLIQQQNDRQMALISNLPGVAYRRKIDKDFTMLYVSDQIVELTGYEATDFYEGKVRYGQLIHPDDYEHVYSQYLKEVAVGKTIKTDYRIIDKAHNVRMVHVSATFIQSYSDSEELILEGFIQDITENHKIKTEVNYQKDLLQYIISRSHQGIAVHDVNMNYVYVSNRYCEMYNVSMDIIGKHHYDIFPDLPQKWRDVHQRSLQGETLSEDRDQYVREDGSIQYTRWLSQPWYDVDNNIAGIIIYTEVINALVEAEVELKKSNNQLQLVMDSLPIGIAVNSVDPNVSFDYMNDNFPLIYGTTRKALEKPDSFWDVVYEDEHFREEIKSKVLEDIASLDPARMVWKDVPISKDGKAVRYVNAYSTPVPDSNLFISTVIDVTSSKQKELEILYASMHDFLTGLPNRRYFEQTINELDSLSYYPLLITMIDLDGLKLINDAYGHDVGDQALITVAQILQKHLRLNDFVARIGGDEFVILSSNTSAFEFEPIKRSIQQQVSNSNHKEIQYSLSFGEAVKEDASLDVRDVLKQAENNMYANKTLHGQSARNETIMTLFQTLNEKYDEERIHSDRVSQLCKQMGEKLNLNIDQIKELEFAGLMHDIGKITIPDSILDKPGQLSEDEWVIMKKHTINGYHILRSANQYSRLAEYALTHHERWDGKGYPNNLSGTEIPLFSRIIAIADSYEAMTANRPYRKALCREHAIAELKRCSGTQFDPDLVEVFINEVV